MEQDFNIINLENTFSTSEKAKELFEQGVLPWTAVVAKEQTAGHGRKGDSWFSPKGGLYASVILPKSNIDDLQTITILAAFVVAQILKDDYGLEPLIKLPNDILLNGKKIGGILTENIIIGAKPVVSVIGIGLDTNIDEFPDDLKDMATSLEIELGRKVDNEKILQQILNLLKKQLETINK